MVGPKSIKIDQKMGQKRGHFWVRGAKKWVAQPISPEKLVRENTFEFDATLYYPLGLRKKGVKMGVKKGSFLGQNGGHFWVKNESFLSQKWSKMGQNNIFFNESLIKWAKNDKNDEKSIKIDQNDEKSIKNDKNDEKSSVLMKNDKIIAKNIKNIFF